MIRLAVAFAVFSSSVAADPIRFPSNATLTHETVERDSAFQMPSGVWDGQRVPVISVEGNVTQQSWQIAAPDLTLVQLLRPLREQLRNAGYDVLFECETNDCGGFDFRFGIKVLPPPNMFVNLTDFRQLSAWRTLEDGSEEAISLLVSRSGEAGFVQMTYVGQEVETVGTAGAPRLQTATSAVGLGGNLEDNGHAVLEGLSFERGSARLSEGPFGSLQELADYLDERPDLKIALVGHTDAEGSLDGNIALSKRRAASVLERLVTEHDVDRTRMEAQGMGYLSPIANNLTEEGRTANRRVEVIITSTN